MQNAYNIMHEYYNAQPTTAEINKDKPDITSNEEIHQSWQESLLRILTFGIYKSPAAIQQSFTEKVKNRIKSTLEGAILKN